MAFNPDKDIHQKERGNTFAKRCKHFAGLNFTDDEKKCDAGVRMKDVIVNQPYRYKQGKGSPVFTTNHSLPCFSDDDPCGVCSCEHQEFPTQEEIEERKEEQRKSSSRVMTARAAIVEHSAINNLRVGELECPICKIGKLRYGIAESNGHIHAGCTTESCVAWME